MAVLDNFSIKNGRGYMDYSMACPALLSTILAAAAANVCRSKVADDVAFHTRIHPCQPNTDGVMDPTSIIDCILSAKQNNAAAA